MYEGPGIYAHYKGGNYRVLGLSQHESTKEQLVIYHSYNVTYDVERKLVGVDFIARPLDVSDGRDAFNERVDAGGGNKVERFYKIA